MPLYDYECDACGSKTEEFGHMADPPLDKCPICGKLKLRRLIGCPALHTDTSYIAGIGTLQDQFDNEGELMRVVNAAKKNGYTPKATDIYEPGMANKCGDPAAFVPHTDPKTHIRRVCEKRDVTCHGAVEVKRKGK
ncbi:MAG: zinc ribbon domain-containing protein [Chloroflexota bacterium]|nr:zinc ribbon domain-containing protein [Chloroflexota bacterium]